MWNELTFLWNELTILWNDLTIDWNDLTWNDLTMERNDRKSSLSRVSAAPPCSLRACLRSPPQERGKKNFLFYRL